MGEYNWQTIRDRAASVLGYPDAATAQPIIDQFEENPAAVSQAVDKIVSRVRAGKLQAHAGWLIIGREAEAIGRPAPNVVANDEGEKQRRLAGALKWVDHTGLYFDRPEAVLDQLEVVTVEELAAQYEPTPWDDAYHPGPVDNDELLAWGMPWGRDWQLGWS